MPTAEHSHPQAPSPNRRRNAGGPASAELESNARGFLEELERRFGGRLRVRISANGDYQDSWPAEAGGVSLRAKNPGLAWPRAVASSRLWVALMASIMLRPPHLALHRIAAYEWSSEATRSSCS